MIHRMRIYRPASKTQRESSHEVFHNHVLPVHLKHGAHFVGRWETEDGRIVVLWAYEDKAACERIQRAVRDDPESVAAEQLRQEAGLLGAERDEWLMVPTSAHGPGWD